ncbi:bifunctional DNA primase/polymerase [Hoeflea sp. G2-23]|uniref:Bifunctional DNA primase/polymerase n=1 Tax=Hoeflea algicola TaxID=2983763 RepID=A0ABT3Z969_9HYPH|nr:bifunctional DNA primase/polymerase [Hoeflea algicola]MCY0148329.1 bifunctional DNA primase/polymerase [Hoeflea algicola]
MTENPFKKLLDLGFTRLVPIIPPNAPISERSNLFKRIEKGDDARGKVPGIRWPDGSWSGYDFVSSEEIHADKWHEMGANVGIKTGQGLVGIDADTKTLEHAKIIKELIEAKFGHLPVRIGDFPKALYLVKTDTDFSYARIEFGERNDKGLLQDRVEILAEGKQFVAIGTHPKTMKPYRWPKGIPNLDGVPFISGKDLLNLLEELRPLLPAASKVSQEGSGADVDQESLRGNIEIIAKAVKATPNTSNHFPTRESYRDFGYAIKAAAGPEHEAEALELFMDWCDRWVDGQNEPEIVVADWNRMKPPFRRGASFIYEQATKYGMDFDAGEAVADKWFEKIQAPYSPKSCQKLLRNRSRNSPFWISTQPPTARSRAAPRRWSRVC